MPQLCFWFSPLIKRALLKNQMAPACGSLLRFWCLCVLYTFAYQALRAQTYPSGHCGAQHLKYSDKHWIEDSGVRVIIAGSRHESKELKWLPSNMRNREKSTMQWIFALLFLLQTCYLQAAGLPVQTADDVNTSNNLVVKSRNKRQITSKFIWVAVCSFHSGHHHQQMVYA